MDFFFFWFFNWFLTHFFLEEEVSFLRFGRWFYIHTFVIIMIWFVCFSLLHRLAIFSFIYYIYIYIYTTCVLLIRFADSRAKLIRFSFLLLCFWFFFFWFYLCVLLPSLFCVVFFLVLIGSTHESRQDINRWTVCNILSNSTWPSLSRANNLTFRVWSAASFLHFLQIYFVFYHFFF